MIGHVRLLLGKTVCFVLQNHQPIKVIDSADLIHGGGYTEGFQITRSHKFCRRCKKNPL